MIFNWGRLPKLQGTVVTGETTYKILANQLVNNSVIILKKNQKNLESLEIVSEEIKQGPLLAIGGGTTIDSVKILSNILNMDWISIPTALSHDGLASKIISLKNYHSKSIKPLAVFGVENILENNILNRAGLGDIFSKYSALADWSLALERKKAKKSNECFELIFQALQICEKNDNSLFKALCLSGIAMNRFGSSRPASGSEHAIVHSLKNGQHGFKVAIATLFTLSVFERTGLDNFTLIHSKDLKKKMKEKNLPTTLDEIGITRTEFINAVEKAPNLRDRYGILNEISLKRLEIEKIIDSISI